MLPLHIKGEKNKMENKKADMPNTITYEQFLAMKEKFDKAENDTTPYAIVPNDDEIKVVGDVNKTEANKHNYVIQFAFRNTPYNKELLTAANEKIIGETENYIGVERTYTDAWIPPRKHTEVQSVLVQLYKFFNAVTEDGEIRDMTPDETLAALRTLNDEIIDAMCDVLGVILNIPSEEREYILLPSAIEASLQVIDDFPEVVNGADFIIGNSSESR